MPKELSRRLAKPSRPTSLGSQLWIRRCSRLGEGSEAAAREAPARPDQGAFCSIASGLDTIYSKDRAEAAPILEQAIARFRRGQAVLKDPTLARELELIEKLRDLVEEGAPQGSLYGSN